MDELIRKLKRTDFNTLAERINNIEASTEEQAYKDLEQAVKASHWTGKEFIEACFTTNTFPFCYHRVDQYGLHFQFMLAKKR